MRRFWIIITVIPAFLLAYASFSHALSRISPSQQPVAMPLAHAVAPLRYIDKRLPPQLEGVDTQKLRNLALVSLRYEPINPRAIRMLALDARAKNRPDDVLRFAKMSRKLSRRDGTTHLLLIENLAAQPDTTAESILNLYDIALRVNSELRDRLYPALAQITLLPQGQQALVPYVKKQTQWIPDVFTLALAGQSGPSAVAKILLRAYPGKTVIMPDRMSSGYLFNRLFSEKEYLLMRQFFLRMEETSPDWLTSKDLKLARLQNKYGPIIWQFNNTVDFGAEILELKDNNELVFNLYTSTTNRNMVAKKLIFTDDVASFLPWKPRILDIDEGMIVTSELRCLRNSDEKRLKRFEITGNNILTIDDAPPNTDGCIAYTINIYTKGSRLRRDYSAYLKSEI